MIKRFRHALAFLTRLPGGIHPNGDEVSACVPYFGLVGLVVGSFGASIFWLASEYTTAPIGAASALIVTALVTGALHEDGLGDTFDALAGGWTRERRFEILKDSRQGTFGVMAIVGVSLLKFAALSSLGARDGAVALLVAHIAARSAAVGVMGIMPTARLDGLGVEYSKGLAPLATGLGVLVGLVALVLAFSTEAWFPLLMVVVSALIISAWARTKIGGVTGDILGTVEQVSETTILVAAVALAVG